MDMKGRLFLWPDRQGDTWVVAARTRHGGVGEQWLWYPLSVTTNVDQALDAVMELNKSLSREAPPKAGSAGQTA